MEKLQKRCELQLQNGETNCEKSFQRVHQKCLDFLPAIANQIICSPLKVDLICGMVNIFDEDICDPSDVIDASFGNEYAELKAKGLSFMSDYRNISFNYTKVNPSELHAIRMVNETGREISQILNEKTRLMDYIFYICNELMVVIYLKIVYGMTRPTWFFHLFNFVFVDAIRYHDRFLRNINFHNYYITDYFKRIDRRRIQSGRSHLLPIKNVELNKIVDINESRKLHKEFQGYIGLTLQLFLVVTSSGFFIALDRLYYELLDIVARHSQINFEQSGVHYLNVSVNGTGFIANLIRASIDGINIDEQVETVMTNRECLPRPTLTPSSILIKICFLFLLYLYLIYNQVYIHRLKRFVCAYFYPKREKKRVLYLYNKTLKRRKHIFDSMVETLKYKMKTHSRIRKDNIFQVRKEMRGFFLFL